MNEAQRVCVCVCVFQEASVFSCAVLHHLPTFPYICVERDRVVLADSAFG